MFILKKIQSIISCGKVSYWIEDYANLNPICPTPDGVDYYMPQPYGRGHKKLQIHGFYKQFLIKYVFQ